MIPFKQFLHPIKPSTNNWRMNYQSKQEIQIFFGKCTVTSQHAVTRYVYGPLAVLKANGAHPSKDYKVRPFTAELLTVFELMNSLMSKIGFQRRMFNFLEIKVYIGDNVFKDMHGKTLTDRNKKPLRLGCNKSVNAHNDLKFSDSGEHSQNDTACSSEPTVTFTIGSTRKLVFHHMTKSKTKKNWTSSNNKHNVIFELDHGTAFVLLPDNDKPGEIHTNCPIKHKTKHGVNFNKDDISFAFVFCRVRTTSKFDPVTNTWLWKQEVHGVKNQVKNYLDNNKFKNQDVLWGGDVIEKLSSKIDKIITSLNF